MADRKSERDAAIKQMIAEVKSALADGVGVAEIETAKSALLRLCARGDLFTFDDYPLPPPDETEKTYMIHCDDDGGFALYVNAGRPGQSYRPHTHGNAWAIVGGICGEETHHLYEATGDDASPIRHKATLKVEPGTAVSILKDGFHAIAAEGSEPLMHLHLYGHRFEDQGTRVEFDEDKQKLVQFEMTFLEPIVDAR